jgi:hypothetical protein
MIREFLNQQAAALDAVHNRETLSTWHRQFAQAWGQSAAALAASANETWCLTGATAIQAEVGYLAAECRPDLRPTGGATWILLSANPGWHPNANEEERNCKGQNNAGAVNLDKYEEYRQAYFPRWNNEVVNSVPNGAAWWNAALRFMRGCAGAAHDNHHAGNPGINIIGWELWPMMSRRDGLTRHAANDKTLTPFARASVAAALRVLESEETRGALIVASAAGFNLLQGLGVYGLRSRDAELVAGVAVRRYLFRKVPEQVHTVPLRAIRRQLFSGWGRVSNDRMQSLVAWVGLDMKAAAVNDEEPDGGWAEEAAADPTDDRFDVLYAILEEQLGRCNCYTERGCVEDRHSFPRASNVTDARAHLRTPAAGGELLVNIRTADVGCFTAEAAQVKELIWREEDHRSDHFTRFVLTPNITNPAHLAFLRRWLPRTIN